MKILPRGGSASSAGHFRARSTSGDLELLLETRVLGPTGEMPKQSQNSCCFHTLTHHFDAQLPDLPQLGGKRRGGRSAASLSKKLFNGLRRRMKSHMLLFTPKSRDVTEPQSAGAES